MKLFFVLLIALLGCSESDSPTKSIPGYLVNSKPDPPEIRYKIPDGIPMPMVEAYADLQDKLTEKQFQFFLMQIRRFCDGHMDNDLLKLRVRLWFPNAGITRGSDYRLPMYNRSIEDRIQAHYSLFRQRNQFGIPDTKIASDTQLSKANKFLHYGTSGYDCVEDYPTEGYR